MMNENLKSHTYRALAAYVATADSPIRRQLRDGKPSIVVVVTPPSSLRRIWPDLDDALVKAAPMSTPIHAISFPLLVSAGAMADDWYLSSLSVGLALFGMVALVYVVMVLKLIV